jgi:hypothetical protein
MSLGDVNIYDTDLRDILDIHNIEDFEYFNDDSGKYLFGKRFKSNPNLLI